MNKPNTPSGPERSVEDMAIQKLGDNTLAEMLNNPNHICNQLKANEVISYNTGFHAGFKAGFFAASSKVKEEEKPVENNSIETFDLSHLSEEDKAEFLNGLTKEVCKNYLAVFISLGLKTHIEQMIVEENTGQEYILTFRTLPEHMKKRIFEKDDQPKDTSGMQWQLCPKCNGNGNLPIADVDYATGVANFTCDLCNGKKVIEPPSKEGEEDAVDGWVNEKPKFKEDCILIAATKYKNEHWHYSLYEIKKSDGEDEDGNAAWYWGIFCDDGEEWGDLADLNADKYLILKPLP